MFHQYKPIIITFSVIALIIIATVQYVQSLINKPIDLSIQNNKLELLDLKPSDNIVIPKEFEFKGAKIALAWTDDNTGEDLIIQSDKKIYNGFNQIDVFFSITNISKKDQAVDIKFLSQKNNHINLINPCERIVSNLADTSAPSAAPALGAGKTNFYKATLKFPPMTKGEFFIKATGDKGGYGYLDPWYNSNWSYWKKITIASSTVATTTSNFPVLATSTDSDLRTITHGGHVGNDNGYDIVFADSDGETLLNYEREKYASTTGEIAYWIKTDISSTTDKTIYMYYGNSGASDQATTTGVWDDNFVMVNHLAHDGVATTTYPDFNDSTKYNNDGSSKNMNSDDLVDGQIDGSLDFDGANDIINVGDSSSLDMGTEDFSVSFWEYSVNSHGTIIMKQNDMHTSGNSGIGWGIGVTDSGYYYIRINKDATGTALNVGSDDNNYDIDGKANYVVVNFHRTGNVEFIIDGQSAGGGDISAEAGSLDNVIPLIIGANYDVGLFNGWFPGPIDEVRISNVARTAQWIETEYNNQVSVGDFMTFGAEVCVPKPVERSGGENVKIRIKGGTRIKGGVRF